MFLIFNTIYGRLTQVFNMLQSSVENQTTLATVESIPQMASLVFTIAKGLQSDGLQDIFGKYIFFIIIKFELPSVSLNSEQNSIQNSLSRL